MTNYNNTNTNGGAYIGGDVNTRGDAALRDMIKITNCQTIVQSTNPALQNYIDLIQNARQILAHDQTIAPIPDRTPALTYYEWLRPQFEVQSPDEEIEIQGVVINHLPESVEIVDIELPIDTSCFKRFDRQLGIIPPFGTLRAIHYVTLAGMLKVRPTPHILYCVNQEAEIRDDVMPQLQLSDEANVFVPLVDRQDVLTEFKERVQTARPGMPIAWLAIVGAWGTGRSRALAECVHIAQQQTELPLEVLEKGTSPTDIVNMKRDPIRDALLDKLGSFGGTEDVLHLVLWFSNLPTFQPDDSCLALVAQYLWENAESEKHLRIVAESLWQRARYKPILWVNTFAN